MQIMEVQILSGVYRGYGGASSVVERWFVAPDTRVQFSCVAPVRFGPFVYRLGHQPFKLKRRVQFPHGLPTKIPLDSSMGRTLACHAGKPGSSPGLSAISDFIGSNLIMAPPWPSGKAPAW